MCRANRFRKHQGLRLIASHLNVLWWGRVSVRVSQVTDLNHQIDRAVETQFSQPVAFGICDGHFSWDMYQERLKC